MNLKTPLAVNDPYRMQKTLLNPVICQGVGVHSGAQVTIQIMPAKEGYGICFERTDVSTEQKLIPARWSAVSATELCTQISNEAGVSVATIEHLMAALAFLEIDNAHILVDGAEIPIMDGSSAPFVTLLIKAGLQEQTQPRRVLRILKEISIQGSAGRTASLKPSDKFSIEYRMDFSGRNGITPQDMQLTGAMSKMREATFQARTFGFLEDVEKMRMAGLAQGGSLENAVVIDQGKILNADGLRYENEFIRHKILDAIGDLYLAGGPILGAYQSRNGGHQLNNQLLRHLMDDSTAWSWEPIFNKVGDSWQPLTGELFEPVASFA